MASLENGFANERMNTVVGRVTTASGVLIGAGIASGVLAPGATVAAGAVGAANAAYATARLWQMADAANYPSRLTTMDVGIDKPTMNEDFTRDGKITKIVVTAASTGFNAADALSGIGASALEAVASAGVGKALGKVGAVAEGAMTSSGFLRENALAELLKAGEESLEFCGQRWDVRLPLNKKYLTVFPVGGIDVNVQAGTYRPTEVGTAKIRFETTSFFPQVYAIADATVVTERLEVFGSPIEIEVKRAGEVVSITGTLVSADTLDLAWEETGGEWKDGIAGNVTDSAVTTRLLETPKNPESFPVTVTMTSLSKTGLRAGAADERSAVVTIRIPKIIVTPNPGTVQPKGDRQFEATDQKGAPVDVRWEATGGDISSSGMYTAFEKPGTYTVTAISKDDPKSKGTAVVIVSELCPVGTWVLRSAEFFAQLGEAAGGDVRFVGGEDRLVMADDGTYVDTRAGWQFVQQTNDGPVTVTIDGVTNGTWAATEDTLIFEEAGGSSTATMEFNGRVITAPPSASDTGSVTGEAPFTCDDDVMTVNLEIASTFDRVSR